MVLGRVNVRLRSRRLAPLREQARSHSDAAFQLWERALLAMEVASVSELRTLAN